MHQASEKTNFPDAKMANYLFDFIGLEFARIIYLEMVQTKRTMLLTIRSSQIKTICLGISLNLGPRSRVLTREDSMILGFQGPPA